MKKIVRALGFLALLSLVIAPTASFAKSVPPKMAPNLNAFLISEPGAYPYSLSNPKNRSINYVRFSLPAGRDNFYSFVYIATAPHGTDKAIIRIFSPTGKMVDSATDTFYTRGMYGSEIITTKWHNVPISPGYNVAKVWLNGRYVGKSLIWSN